MIRLPSGQETLCMRSPSFSRMITIISSRANNLHLDRRVTFTLSPDEIDIESEADQFAISRGNVTKEQVVRKRTREVVKHSNITMSHSRTSATISSLSTLTDFVTVQRRRLLRLNMASSCLLSLAFLCLLLPAIISEHHAQAFESRRRVKRALYELPDGSEQILGTNLRTTFTCEGLGYGYYADQDNDCKIFHICQSFKMSDGSIYNNHWSFMCGNQTVFNQLSLACSHPEDSVPCESAKEFYHINDYFGDVRAPSVKESDLTLASELISRSYGSRLSAGQ